MCPTAGCRGEPRVGRGLVVPVEEGRVYGRRGRLRVNSGHREQCLVRLVSGQRVGDERVEARGPLGAASTPRVYAEPPQPRHPYAERAVEIFGRWCDFSSTGSPTSAHRPHADRTQTARERSEKLEAVPPIMFGVASGATMVDDESVATRTDWDADGQRF